MGTLNKFKIGYLLNYVIFTLICSRTYCFSNSKNVEYFLLKTGYQSRIAIQIPSKSNRKTEQLDKQLFKKNNVVLCNLTSQNL